VDAKTFAYQMAFLARHFNVLPLIDAVQAMKDRQLPHRACCITFDDGYADNLTVAQPILDSYKLPATVFVASGYLDGGRMFNDTIIEFVASVAGPLLDLQEMGLGLHRVGSNEQRREAIKAILAVVRFLPPQERDELVLRVVQSCPVAAPPTDLMMTTEQVAELSSRGIEIGGHTVAHTVLTTLDHKAAQAEICKGKQRLEAITGKRLRSFAYPNGRPNDDYTLVHAAMVKAAGFEVAVTTSHGVSDEQCDVYQLPRFAPWGKSMVKFSARLARNARLGRPASVCISEQTTFTNISGNQNE
jgi:peptidoglycan/xylan/chitin deacetylase (PgdA/CDA1 family)